MCGGNRNFVAGANAEAGLQYAMETQPFDAGALKSHSFLQRRDPRAHPLRLRRGAARDGVRFGGARVGAPPANAEPADLLGSMESRRPVTSPIAHVRHVANPADREHVRGGRRLDAARCANPTARAACRAPAARRVRRARDVPHHAGLRRRTQRPRVRRELRLAAGGVRQRPPTREPPLRAHELRPAAGAAYFARQLIALDEYWHISEAMPEALYIAARDGGCKNATARARRLGLRRRRRRRRSRAGATAANGTAATPPVRCRFVTGSASSAYDQAIGTATTH